MIAEPGLYGTHIFSRPRGHCIAGVLWGLFSRGCSIPVVMTVVVDKAWPDSEGKKPAKTCKFRLRVSCRPRATDGSETFVWHVNTQEAWLSLPAMFWPRRRSPRDALSFPRRPPTAHTPTSVHVTRNPCLLPVPHITLASHAFFPFPSYTAYST
jgi:hypothetical protein